VSAPILLSLVAALAVARGAFAWYRHRRVEVSFGTMIEQADGTYRVVETTTIPFVRMTRGSCSGSSSLRDQATSSGSVSTMYCPPGALRVGYQQGNVSPGRRAILCRPEVERGVVGHARHG
jgi:hypothetical protein